MAPGCCGKCHEEYNAEAGSSRSPRVLTARFERPSCGHSLCLKCCGKLVIWNEDSMRFNQMACPFPGCGTELDEVPQCMVHRSDTVALAEEHFVPNYTMMDAIASGGGYF
jgi:hypothetical protein